MKDSAPDLGRYESSAGWDPDDDRNDPYKKLREKARKKLASLPQPHQTMIETRAAGAWRPPRKERKAYSPELFADLWRKGEVAILFGSKNSGKSVLAVQLAEAIARGKRLETGDPRHEARSVNSLVHQIQDLRSRTQDQKVLYFDFQRTPEQWNERYSAPSPIPGKLPVRHRFSPNFLRAAVEFNGDIPPAFKGDVSRFLQYSVAVRIAEAEPAVVMIDNLSYLFGNISNHAIAIRAMKTLKFWSAKFGVSILAIAQMKDKRKPSPVTLGDIAASRHIVHEADTVFALGTSTFGPQYRYIKHLASPHPITRDAEDLLTYELARTADALVRSSTARTADALVRSSTAGTDALVRSSTTRTADALVRPSTTRTADALVRSSTTGTADALVRSSTAGTADALVRSSTAERQRPTAKCFLALTYLGPSVESDHLRDYAAAVAVMRHTGKSSVPGPAAADRAHAREIKNLARLSAKEAIVEGFLDGSYGRYLDP
ncbi:MAG: AAA family ATPase [Pyrinomonadaceae bacterium]